MTALDATTPADPDRALDFIRELLRNSRTQAHQDDHHTQARQRELIYELTRHNLTVTQNLIQAISDLPPHEAELYRQQFNELTRILNSNLQEAVHEMMRISHQEGRRARQNLRDGAGELDTPK